MLDVIDLNLEFHDHLIPETVVFDFDLHMEPGEIVGLVGESGSGKSMTALAAAGLLSRHDMQKRGRILFEGVDILTCERSRLRGLQGDDIAMIFQEPMTSLNPVLPVGWQVEEALRIHRPQMDREERKRRALQMLADVELEDAERVYRSYPHQLSGGMRQRVMIAAAMICEPRLLIADEPTTALDVTIQHQIVQLLLRINREKKTAILFISHDLSLVRQLCRRVVVMQSGRIVESGDAEEIFSHPKEDYTRRLIAAIPRCEKEKDSPASQTVDGGDGSLLEVSGIRIGFAQERRFLFERRRIRQVLKGVSFGIRQGEVLGLVGESGCGKSTLAKVILGLEKQGAGTVVHRSAHPQMVFQDPYGSLNPSRKVGWILEEPLRIRGGCTPQERRERALAMLQKVGLGPEIADRYPRQLSGGQRQRVCIGAALMLEPKLLIADEAVSALDVTIQDQILELLLSLKEEMGLSILFISHDMRVVYRMSDRVLIMQDGQIVEQGSVEQVYFAPQHPYTKRLLEAADIRPEETG